MWRSIAFARLNVRKGFQNILEVELLAPPFGSPLGALDFNLTRSSLEEAVGSAATEAAVYSPSASLTRDELALAAEDKLTEIMTAPSYSGLILR